MPGLDTVMTTLLLAATLSFGEWLMGNPINAYTFERWAIILIPIVYVVNRWILEGRTVAEWFDDTFGIFVDIWCDFWDDLWAERRARNAEKDRQERRAYIQKCREKKERAAREARERGE